MDFKLHPTTHDLVFDDTGDLGLVDGNERIAQQIRIRLGTFRGEWFADRRVGMPYYQRIIGIKPIRQAIIGNAIRQAVIGVPGVREMDSFRLRYENDTRRISIQFRALTDLGDPINFDEPFVIR